MRYVHKHMYIGIHESEARNMMSTALSEVGLSDGGCLTLFGGLFDSYRFIYFGADETWN